MVTKLVRLRPGNFALAEESALVEATARCGGQAQSAHMVRLPHQARHAKAADPEPPSPPSLPMSREIPPEGRHRAANRLRPRLRPFVQAGAAWPWRLCSPSRPTGSGPRPPGRSPRSLCRPPSGVRPPGTPAWR